MNKLLEEEELNQVPPPTMAAPAPMPAAPPPQKLPGMPPTVTPDDLTPYLALQKQQTQRFGPDETIALQKSLNDRQDSFANRLTSGAKGFADALMMGVARAGNPGFQQAYDQGEQQFAQNQMATLKDARDANFKQVESGMTIDRMDPNSPASRSSQQAYAPLVAKLGYPPEALKGMSAANIDNTLQLMAAYGGKEIEAMIKEYELAIERARLGQANAKAQSEKEIAAENQRIQAAKDLSGQKEPSKFFGLFGGGPTDASEKGTQYLEEKLDAADITPDVAEYAKKHGITPQKALEIKRARGG